MTRWLKLTIAYDGGAYHGWQLQQGPVTVQEALETAWREVTGESLRLTAAGRTDAGVHAYGQVLSVATETRHSCDVLRKALDAVSPRDIAVLEVAEAPADFHATVHARRKRYRYVIQDGRLTDVFLRRHSWRIFQSLDAAAMHRAAEPLRGRRDFAAFQSTGSERATTVRTVYDLVVERCDVQGLGRIQIEIEADGFLYNMVRNVVGTLVEVGEGGRPESWVAEVRDGLDRTRAGQTAPAQGLFLLWVAYD